MDDDFIINWNLKGPKRMKTRKELNALKKNDRTGTSSRSKENLTIESLLNHSSSSDRELLYFSANKEMIKKRKSKNMYKVIKRTVFIALLATCLIMNIVLIYWNINLKKELMSLKEETQKYSVRLANLLSNNSKKNNLSPRLASPSSNYHADADENDLAKLENSKVKDTSFQSYIKKLIEDKYNEMLIKFNRTTHEVIQLQNSNLIDELNFLKRRLNQTLNENFSTSSDLKQIKNHLENLKLQLVPELKIKDLIDEKFQSYQNQLNLTFINPIFESFEKCNCKL